MSALFADTQSPFVAATAQAKLNQAEFDSKLISIFTFLLVLLSAIADTH